MVFTSEELTSSFGSTSTKSTSAFTKRLFQLIYISKNHVYDAFEYRIKKLSVGILPMLYKIHFTSFFSIRFDNTDLVSAPVLRASFPDLLC